MRKQLPTAPAGWIYTDGKKTYGEDIDLGEGRTEAEFYLITREEYNAILEAQKPKEAAVIYENEDTV